MTLCRAKRSKAREKEIMSTPAEENVVSTATMERRFYTRIPPSGVVGIVFGEDNPGMILNVSENGLLVSTPLPLSRDAVFPLWLGLEGLPNPIEVIGRVVWTVDTNRAGIQLLNLRDHDREQIRVWAAFGSAETTETAGADGSREVVASERSSEIGHSAQVEMGGGGVSRAPERRTFSRATLAVGAAMAVVALALGLSLRGSPMRSWLSHVAQAAAKNVNAIDRTEVKSSGPIKGKTAGDVGDSSAVDDAKPTSGDGSAVQAAPDVREKEAVGDANSSASAPEPDAASAPAGKDLSSKKNASKTNSSGDLKVAAADAVGADGSLSISNDRPSKSGQTEVNIPIPMNDGESTTGSEPAPEAAGAGEASASAPPAGNATASAKESAAQPEVATKTSAVNAPSVNPTIPLVIKMDGPKNEIVEITLPKGPRAGSTLLSVPGERVIQSAAVTMHVQRAVVVDGGQGWWSSNRKKKVVLGELAERVDPQTPRQQNGREGRVSVRAIIGKDGRIERVRPVNGSIALVPSVVRAIREWRFEPTLVDGKPVETGVLLAVEFRAPQSAASKP
jgi:hypothetical protein